MECSRHHAGLEQSRYVEKYLTVPQGALFLVLFSGFYSPSLFFVCLLLIFVFLNFVFKKKKIGGHLLLETELIFFFNLKQ